MYVIIYYLPQVHCRWTNFSVIDYLVYLMMFVLGLLLLLGEFRGLEGVLGWVKVFVEAVTSA